MARWDYRYLGAEEFPETLSALEIEHFFTLDVAELAEVQRRRGAMNRLAVALQIRSSCRSSGAYGRIYGPASGRFQGQFGFFRQSIPAPSAPDWP